MNTLWYPKQKHSTSLVLATLASLALGASNVNADTRFNQINLVTDDPAINPARLTDADLKNPWGIAFSSTAAFWISDNATHVSTLYSLNTKTNTFTKPKLTVSIPGDGSVTGQVFNNKSTAFNGDPFIFVSEDGTISGWRGALGTSAEILKTGSVGNVYKGVAEATVANDNYLYAANFGAGTIDVIKDAAGAPSLSGNFIDPNLPTGYAPFNIQDLNGKLFVTYAKQDADKHDEIAGAGNGFVDEFDTQGNLLARIASNGALDAPWGLAIAPSTFGEYAGDLLVGNFGDGTINAYNLITHHYDGQLIGSDGKPLSIDGLWALSIGNDGSAGSVQALYFTAGPNGEVNGLFGSIAAVPLPASLYLFSSALFALGFCGKRKAG